jgi:predicted dienelactone hydrolase
MPPSSLILAAAFCCATTLSQAAGLQFIEVPVESEGAMLFGVVWYPCAAPVQEVRLRGLAVPGVADCPVAGDKLPLVVVSHGRTGWVGGHHDTAAALADAGFVVAAIEHRGDNAFDASRTDDISVALERPADLKRLVDFMLAAWPDAAKIDPGRIGLYGFSRGGYTGLVAIGGTPNFRRAAARCAEGASAFGCKWFRNGGVPAQQTTHDLRIKAAVIIDPGFTFLFGPDDLKGVSVPVQLWSSEHGGGGVTLQSVAAVRDKLRSSPDYRVAANAGHFAFLAPCSPGQTKANPRVCVDAPGFDRVAFHQALNAEVLAFLRKHLVAAGKL